MRYVYECIDCLEKAIREHEERGEHEEHGEDISKEEFDSLVLYETSHSMKPTEEERHEACECPRCGGHNARRYYHGQNNIGFIRGYGYLDKAGCHRDMNKFKLLQDDPYAEYRQPGEVDDIKTKLDRAGKHNPKRQYYTPVKSMEKAVEKATHNNTSTPPSSSNG